MIQTYTNQAKYKIHLLKHYTIRHPALTSVDTLSVKCCTDKYLLPSKTLPKMLN